MRLVRPAALLFAALCGTVSADRAAIADDPPPPGDAPKPDAPKPDAPKPEPSKGRALTKPERAEMREVLRTYLEPGDQDLKNRLKLIERAKALREAGVDLLADIDALSSLVYASRTFAPPLSKKMFAKDDKSSTFRTGENAVCRLTTLSWDRLRFTLSEPKAYAAPDPKSPVEKAPWPLIVTLHEKDDYEISSGSKPWPGEEVLKRRYDPAGPMKSVLSEWFVLAPVATKGRWLKEDGQALAELLREPSMVVFQRYHIDFDRVVLDGGSEALTFAASDTFFYGGLIIRGDAADVAPEIVRNFAHVPIYIVGTDKSAALQTLTKSGFPADKVEVGGVDGLPKWLKEKVGRKTPKSFRWTMKDRSTMSQAHWVSIATPEDGVTPALEVEAVDTTEEPNTIKIKSVGIRAISLWLSDRIVDLSREVRVIVNGKPVTSAVLGVGREGQKITLPAKLDRNLDVTFSGSLVNIRRSRYYGWLYPVLLNQIQIPGDDPGLAGTGGGEPAPGGAATTDPNDPDTAGAGEAAQREKDAKQYYDKGVEAEKAGNLDKARGLYAKAVAQGETPIKAQAEAKLKELDAKNQQAPKGSPGK